LHHQKDEVEQQRKKQAEIVEQETSVLKVQLDDKEKLRKADELIGQQKMEGDKKEDERKRQLGFQEEEKIAKEEVMIKAEQEELRQKAEEGISQKETEERRLRQSTMY
jgi:hypothetical protein